MASHTGAHPSSLGGSAVVCWFALTPGIGSLGSGGGNASLGNGGGSGSSGNGGAALVFETAVDFSGADVECGG